MRHGLALKERQLDQRVVRCVRLNNLAAADLYAHAAQCMRWSSKGANVATESRSQSLNNGGRF